MIHPTAQIDPTAKLAADVQIGAYSVIGANVEIGAGTQIGPHVVIQGPTRIGRNNRITQFASIGGDPQDKKYHGEQSLLVIGDDNLIREFATINRGTADGGGVTRIGNSNWIMAYVHIAHDCIVGNHTVFSNNATLAGHVEIGDFTILSGFSGVHQFCRVGAHAFLGMHCVSQRRRAAVRDDGGRLRSARAASTAKGSSGAASRPSASPRSSAPTGRCTCRSSHSRRRAPYSPARAVEAPDVRTMLEFIERGQRPLAR